MIGSPLSATVTGLELYAPLVCSIAYAILTAFIVLQARERGSFALSACCAVTSVWAAASAVWPISSITGLPGLIDISRIVAWYAYLLYLYRRTQVAPTWQLRIFAGLGVFVVVVALGHTALVNEQAEYGLFSVVVALRLLILVFELLLIENLYLNLPEAARWHVALPCVLLGAVACLDILVVADAALYHRLSPALVVVRAVVLLVIAPFLLLAAFREQRWHQPVQLSRAAVFHSATLVLSGSVLLVLALMGELLRRFNDELGWIVELSLVSSGVLGVLLAVSSRSARSALQRTVTRHFFADRYDYRQQWLQCISTLSGTASNETLSLSTRAIRAVADVVNSPNGALFLLGDADEGLSWAGSWNMPVVSAGAVNDDLLRKALRQEVFVEFGSDSGSARTLHPELGPLWLGIPLMHLSGPVGVVVVGPPRVPFRLDQEVFDLLQIIGREVATYLAEQKAMNAVVQTRDLHNYSKNFAFVAHDIKNVSSQLALLLRNAEIHIANPDFQKDLIETIRASVAKIDALLQRLRYRTDDTRASLITPVQEIQAALSNLTLRRAVHVSLRHDGSNGRVRMNSDAFNAAIGHLVDNAIEARSTLPVEVEVRHEAERIVIDIVDHGEGMSPAFIRDKLFTPFQTSKADGSGIGAYQARELLREAGGQLSVTSVVGTGTTMHIVLPRHGDVERTRDLRSLVDASESFHD